MAVNTKSAVDLRTRSIPSGTWGVVQYAEFSIAFANGDDINSTLDVGILKPGMRPIDAALHVTAAGVASSTADVGFKSVVGTNQDATAWAFAVQAFSSTTFVRRTANNVPFTAAQEMYIRVTVKGANQTGASAMTLQLWYQYVGTL